MTTYSSLLLLHMFHVVVWEKERLLFIWEKRHIKKNTLEKFEKWLWLSLCMNLQFFNLTSVMHSVWKLFVFTFQNSKYFLRHFLAISSGKNFSHKYCWMIKSFTSSFCRRVQNGAIATFRFPGIDPEWKRVSQKVPSYYTQDGSSEVKCRHVQSDPGKDVW